MIRFDDWLPRLDRLLRDRRAMPFRWGANDCVTFAADAVLAMTGVDAAAAWRGRYAGKRAARRLIAEHGRDLGAALLVCMPSLDLAEIAPITAGRGDVGVSKRGLGIFWNEFLIGPGREGLRFQPRGLARRAWRV